MKKEQRFQIKASFIDKNIPAINQDAPDPANANSVAWGFFNQFASLKSVWITDRKEKRRDVYVPTPTGLSYQFTLTEIKL